MKKDRLAEQYKNVYTKILPSDRLAQELLQRRKHKRLQTKKYYIAASVSFILLCSTVTGYALTHASLVKEFFGDGKQSQAAQESYSDIGKTITCEGNRYTIEGNLYSDKLQKGYLAIKIEGKDLDTSDVSWEDGIMPVSGASLSALGLQVKKSYVGILFSEQVGSSAKIAKEEDGIGIYIAYQVENEKKDKLKICIKPQAEIEKQYKESDTKTAFDSECKWTELTYQKIETIEKEYSSGITALMNRFDIRIAWNENENKIENLAVIDASGNRQELLKNGIPVSNETRWDGSTFEQSENGDSTLNARFDEDIHYEGIQLEVNGQLVE